MSSSASLAVLVLGRSLSQSMPSARSSSLRVSLSVLRYRPRMHDTSLRWLVFSTTSLCSSSSLVMQPGSSTSYTSRRSLHGVRLTERTPKMMGRPAMRRLSVCPSCGSRTCRPQMSVGIILMCFIFSVFIRYLSGVFLLWVYRGAHVLPCSLLADFALQCVDFLFRGVGCVCHVLLLKSIYLYQE